MAILGNYKLAFCKHSWFRAMVHHTRLLFNRASTSKSCLCKSWLLLDECSQSANMHMQSLAAPQQSQTHVIFSCIMDFTTSSPSPVQGLVDVELGGNAITVAGIKGLDVGIAVSSSIAAVRLNNNDLREEGAQVCTRRTCSTAYFSPMRLLYQT